MVEVGQVWEFCEGYMVLTLRPRLDLDARYLKEGATGVYWDVVVLCNGVLREDDGCEDWCGIDLDDADWVRLS